MAGERITFESIADVIAAEWDEEEPLAPNDTLASREYDSFDIMDMALLIEGNLMPANLTISDSELARWRDEGLTFAQIADRLNELATDW